MAVAEIAPTDVQVESPFPNLGVRFRDWRFSCGASGGFPWGMAIDHAGHAWVTNTDLDGPVAEVDATGKLVGNYSDKSFTGALTGIAIDASGNVWVGNFAGNSLIEIVGAAHGPQSFPFSGPVYPL
jgi:DNA-binding beta-propeller fold protein YncE